MHRSEIEVLLSSVKGAAFGLMETVTFPSPGIKKVETNKRIILFANSDFSGYEALVRRRLEEAGKDGSDFSLGDLPWGKRIDNSPLIEHNGETYLQVIEIAEGLTGYYLCSTGAEIDPADFGIVRKRTNQGLPPEKEVIVRAYKIGGIMKLTLPDEGIKAVGVERAVLRIV